MYKTQMFDKRYDQYPAGVLIDEAGNGVEYKTGPWRTQRPVYSKEKCSQCMICWIYCPDLSIIVNNKEMTGIDYDHCKGCGICARECPSDALAMEHETHYQHCELKSGEGA
jgi:pyruvate ferredoxin oxidoreductase delta subunit